MRPQHAAGVLDRAPTDLGARGDLAEEGGQAVGVGAVGAADLLDRVQIGEVMAVEHEIVAAAHLRDPVDRKADRLIGHHGEIEQHHRDDQGIDHRGHQDDKRTGVDQITHRLGLDLAVKLRHLLLEHDLPVLEVEAHLLPPFGHFDLDLGLDPPELLGESVEMRRHDRVPSGFH